MSESSAIVTVYYPTIENVAKISRISKQVSNTYVVDNSPGNNSVLFRDKNVIYISMGYNAGISAAFNKVLKSKKINWKEDDYILFFDQDSHIEEGHVEKLIQVYEETKKSFKNLGCLGAMYFNRSNGTYESPHLKKRITNHCYQVIDTITSSLLCQYGNLKDIGFWNETIFLDGADWDLCWRMRASGRICCLTDKVRFLHSVGLGEKKVFGISMRKNAPIRLYYRTRDSLYLLCKFYTPFRIRIRLFIDVTVINILRVIFLDEKMLRMSYIVIGYKDFITQKTGIFKGKK